MVRPVSFKGFQKGFQGVSHRGFRGFQIFLWELCVCIKYLSVGEKTCQGSHLPVCRHSGTGCGNAESTGKSVVVHEKIDDDGERHITLEIHFNLQPIFSS